jgi:hypothetical protein
MTFTSMRDQYMRTGQGFLMVYAITSRSSFEELVGFKDQILRVKETDQVPMVIHPFFFCCFFLPSPLSLSFLPTKIPSGEEI